VRAVSNLTTSMTCIHIAHHCHSLSLCFVHIIWDWLLCSLILYLTITLLKMKAWKIWLHIIKYQWCM
jgi:hypothetical protein